MTRLLSFLILSTLFAPLLRAQEQKRIQFAPGESRAVVEGKITGNQDVLYKLHAKEGQFLTVQIHPEGAADFNIFIPDRGPGDEALFVSTAGGNKYVGQLYKTGNHSILVYMNRAAARRGETVEYKLSVRVSDNQPTEKDEEMVAGVGVPQKVIDDCIAAARKMVPDREIENVKPARGENSYTVDVKFKGVPKPWRCSHDGTKCTGTMYMGEG